jgi:hypothetical protein
MPRPEILIPLLAVTALAIALLILFWVDQRLRDRERRRLARGA